MSSKNLVTHHQSALSLVKGPRTSKLALHRIRSEKFCIEDVADESEMADEETKTLDNVLPTGEEILIEEESISEFSSQDVTSEDDDDYQCLSTSKGFESSKQEEAKSNMFSAVTKQTENSKRTQKIMRKRETLMLNQLQMIIEKVKFKEISQRLDSAPQSGLDQTPAFLFQQECHNSMDIMLPIIQKVRKGKLVL